MSGLWGWIPFIGGLAIILAVAWAMLRGRADTPQDEARTEAATRELYDRQDADDKKRDQGRPVDGDS